MVAPNTPDTDPTLDHNRDLASLQASSTAETAPVPTTFSAREKFDIEQEALRSRAKTAVSTAFVERFNH